MSEDWKPDELSGALAAMARDLLAQKSLQATLDRILDHAITVVDGCQHAGILVVRNGEVETLAASDDGVRASDRVQGELREGPCFDAARRHEDVYRLPDLARENERWPRYVTRARELGIASMMSFLLFTEDATENLGALNLYSADPDAFTTRSEHIGWLLASHAAVAISAATRQQHLRNAIATRQVIGEAVGIVMERYRITDEQAFELLRTTSQHQNVKLRDLANTIARTGELPPQT